MDRPNRQTFEEVDWDRVLEFEEIKIDPSLPVKEKIEELYKLTPYPNCFKSNGFKVIMSYKESGLTSSDNVEAFMENLFQASV
ncbi:MAG: hypothetical protein Q4P28_06345 [Tissierellia bacterium]|nr:hypothetical protein [Tissierellia bacterium]